MKDLIRELKEANTESDIEKVCRAHGLKRDEVMVGDIVVKEGEKRKDSKVKLVTGNVYVSGTAKLGCPALTTVGGNVYVYGTAKLDALTTVGGYVDVSGTARLDALTTVGGNVYVSGTARLDAPLLKEKNTDESKAKSKAALNSALTSKGFILADGILSHVIKKRGRVTLTERVGTGKKEYIVQDGDLTAHGATLAEARADLKFKQGPRDTTPYKKWKLSKEVSLEDAIVAYRTITGACSSGVSGFLETIKVPKKLTVKKIIELTAGKYGSNEFRGFFK